jgi:hypothetical protein
MKANASTPSALVRLGKLDLPPAPARRAVIVTAAPGAEQATDEADEKGGGEAAQNGESAAQPEPEQRPSADQGQPERDVRAKQTHSAR